MKAAKMCHTLHTGGNRTLSNNQGKLSPLRKKKDIANWSLFFASCEQQTNE
jgi:hypothetical protein